MTPLLPATHPAPTTAGSHPLRLDVGHAITVEVDGATVADPDPQLPAQQAGPRLPVVTVRMPGHLAHSLSHLLATWNELTTVMASDLPTAWDWTAYATALHHAAQATGSPDAAVCPRPH